MTRSGEITDEEQIDIWAGHALQGMLSNPKFIATMDEAEIAMHAYGIADSMLAERRRRYASRGPDAVESMRFQGWWSAVQEDHWRRANSGNTAPKEMPEGWLSIYREPALARWLQWTRADESIKPEAWCAVNNRPHFEGCGCNFTEK